MGDRQHYSAEQIIDALKATKGMIYLAADRLGCSHNTIYNYAKRYASVKAELEKQDGVVNDTAELKLFQAIHNGEPWAIKYRLSTKGKDRGYVERQEITTPADDPFTIEVRHVNHREGLAVAEDS